MTAPDKYLKYLKKYFGRPNNRGWAAMKNTNIFLIGLTEVPDCWTRSFFKITVLTNLCVYFFNR